MLPKKITTVNDVKKFFHHLINVSGLNFHPDTPMEDYINTDTGKPTFTKEKAKQYNNLLKAAFNVCSRKGVDIYELSMPAQTGTDKQFLKANNEKEKLKKQYKQKIQLYNAATGSRKNVLHKQLLRIAEGYNNIFNEAIGELPMPPFPKLKSSMLLKLLEKGEISLGGKYEYSIEKVNTGAHKYTELTIVSNNTVIDQIPYTSPATAEKDIYALQDYGIEINEA
jgi:hypothetical protein